MSPKRKRRHQRRSESAPVSATRPSTGFRAKLLLIGLGIAVALTFGEIAIRLLNLGPDLNVVYKHNYRLSSNPVLQYELVPGSQDGAHHISAAGLRDREYPTQKPPGTFRILIIGDSIVYGYGVKQDEALSAQLENLLATYWQNQETRFEVLNLGVTGYSIEQVVENLRVRGLQFDPDLILYGYCLNDPMAYSFELESLKAQLSSAKATYRDELLHRGEALAGKLRIYLLARYAWQALRAQGASTADLKDKQWASISDGTYRRFFDAAYDDDAGAERLRSGIAALRELSDSTGVPVATLLFPIFFDLESYRLQHLHDRVQQLHAQYGLPVYDLLDLYTTMLTAHGNVFVFNALHPNAVGHRLAAWYALHRLQRDGLLPISSATSRQPTRRDLALARVVERVLESAGSPVPSESP